ncbi:tudor domain-containing protein 3 [Biomphalaria pfeifferi]|uniref:Survival of motor neuron-related-splicing factor 30 n=1 Tax=Biomphalaria pfeifferi TaxID=112525 RepID=A0AAD8BEA7_BIOPF|nr:tudor domain-containing protein 3 [Biomphalaria pfeifferi]
MAASELNRRGWHINEEKLSSMFDGSKASVDSIVQKFLDIDLRDIGVQCLNEDINRGRVDYVEGPLVLQLQKLRVVSAAKDNEESQVAPKLCRLSLTDGHVTCSAVTLEPIKGLGTKTPPGSKLQLTGTIEVETNFLLLTNKNTTLLGGRVEGLASTWELKKSLAQQSLTRSSARGEGGPPPFVPFGKKILNDTLPPSKKDNFKSLNNTKEKKTSEETSEFEQQRQAALNEALQAKSSSGGVKTFGGGKVMVNDKDVAKIADMGFSAEEATTALRASNGNFGDALNTLLSGKPRNQRGGIRGGRGGRGDGRRGRGRDYDEDADVPINTRPSGPATLFDFLETKIPTKEEGKKPLRATENKTSSSGSSTLANESTSNKDSGAYTGQQIKFQDSSSKASYKGSNQDSFTKASYQENSQTSQDSYGNRGAQSDESRNQQQVAPRFAKMGRGDNQKGRSEGSGSYEDGSFESKSGAISNQSRTSYKENRQGSSNRGGSRGYSNDNRSSNYQQGNKYNNSQGEQKSYNDQRNSEYKKRSYNQGGDYSRNNYGDHKNNYPSNNFSSQSSYDRNSSQSDFSANQTSNSKEGYGKPFKGGPNNKPAFNKTQPGLMPAPYPHQFAPVTGKSGYNNQQFSMNDRYWPNVGDNCLAKYWEDNEYYPASINAISSNGVTAVVTYLEFGNQEEVYIKDLQPLQQPPGWGYQMGPPVLMPGVETSLHDPSSYQGSTTFVPPMEFTRGGVKRYENDRRKPTQSYYQPPNQKLH